MGELWWKDGVCYQIYPRSFADSDGDGVGDIRGIIEHLDHLSWLGVEGVWLNPTMPSPNRDWGYDVSDYTGVHPELGTMADLDELIAECGRRGIRVLLDLVPNHTSDEHPWFRSALGDRSSPYRDYYVWADPRPDGSPPNNWRSVLGGGSAWSLDGATGQYYLHNFTPHQPDLNWWNPRVRREFEEIMRFWFDRGVAGFRIDVAHALIKDRELRDDLPTAEDDPPLTRAHGLRQVYSMNRPEVHEIFREWRKLADSYDPPRVLVGETFVLDIEQLASYYGSGTDELNLAFNFVFGLGDFEPRALARTVEATELAIPPEAWPVYHGSNHDIGRFPTRWCGGDGSLTRLGLMMLLTLRGTPFLYYGDEIGMPEVDVPRERILDPAGLAGWPQDRGRDGCRTPMQWEPGSGAGFTRPGVEPWLPLGDTRAVNVASQRDDPGSVLWLTRRLIELRSRRPELRSGVYRALRVDDAVWVYRRGSSTVVALNFSERPVTLEETGRVLLATRDGAAEAGRSRLQIEARSGAVVALEV